MRFLIDAQLPPRLARRLAGLGHDAVHLADLGMVSALDQDIWNTASQQAAILVTKDRDFAVARAARNEGPVIVWVRLGNTNNETLIARLVNSMDAIAVAIEQGDSVIEVVPR